MRLLTWTWTISFTNDVGHTGFVANKGSQMDWLGCIILWERLDLSTVSCCPLFRVESHWSMARCRKFTMRLEKESIQKCNQFFFLWGYVHLFLSNRPIDCYFSLNSQIASIFVLTEWWKLLFIQFLCVCRNHWIDFKTNFSHAVHFGCSKVIAILIFVNMCF